MDKTKPRKRVNPWIQARNKLEWENSARQFNNILKGDFQKHEELDTLLEPVGYPEYAEGKLWYINLRYNNPNSELLRADKNTYYSKTHREPGLGRGVINP